MNNYWISNFTEKDSMNTSIVIKRRCHVKKLFDKYSDKMKFAQIYFIKYYLPTILMKVDFSSMINSMKIVFHIYQKLLNYSLDLSSIKI